MQQLKLSKARRQSNQLIINEDQRCSCQARMFPSICQASAYLWFVYWQLACEWLRLVLQASAHVEEATRLESNIRSETKRITIELLLKVKLILLQS